MQKKYQIFVSSTFRDLSDERQDAIRSILDLGHIPAGMELFPASDTEQLSYIKKVIDECDYYVLIMGGRYGSIDDDGVSFTEREYDYAVSTGKVVLAFPHGDLAAIPLGKSDIGDRPRQNLEVFRKKVMTGRLVREWTSREQLEALVVKSLVRAISDFPAIGWIRGDAPASVDILAQVNHFRAENDKLRAELAKAEAAIKPNIANLAGFDEKQNIRYKYTKYYRGSSNGTAEGNKQLTWREIFFAVGHDLMSPKQRPVVGTSLYIYLKEIGHRDNSSSIYSTDIDIIVSHLIALGLLSSYQAKAMNSGIAEFITLTDYGRSKLVEFSAVRSSATQQSETKL